MKVGTRVHFDDDVSDQGEILRAEVDREGEPWYFVAWDDQGRGWYSEDEVREVPSD